MIVKTGHDVVGDYIPVLRKLPFGRPAFKKSIKMPEFKLATLIFKGPAELVDADLPRLAGIGDKGEILWGGRPSHGYFRRVRVGVGW